jgi:hypothetical protein
METINTEFNRERVKLVRIKTETVEAISAEDISRLENKLNNFLLKYNFDTFSFMFELFSLKQEKESMLDVLAKLKIDSEILAEKYNGSNCTGLSILFKKQLKKEGLSGLFLIPSTGEYQVIKAADEYSEIRTVQLLGFLKRIDKKRPFLVAVGITVDKLIEIIDGSNVISFDKKYTVSSVDSDKFTIESEDASGQKVSRVFLLQEILNPDESYQKNLMRTRIRYQITRQFENSKIQISFNLITKDFKLKTPKEELILSPKLMLNYIDSKEGSFFLELFQSKNLLPNLKLFINFINEVREELLIPELVKLIESYETGD